MCSGAGLMPTVILPFRKLFRPLQIDTPSSTIKIPPVSPLMMATFFSLDSITAATVFCFVRGIGMTGYTGCPDGKVVMPWIDRQGIISQFLAEWIVAAMVLSGSAASFINLLGIRNLCAILSMSLGEILSQ
jgi:hypothetical protein